MNKIFKQALLAVATTTIVVAAQAETTLVIVSWGGAYTMSQQRAYHDPYMALNPDIKIVNDDSSSEGASKLRAMVEAGNVTWDLLDAEAPAAITLCDEGLVEEIDFDTVLDPAPDGTPASVDLGGRRIIKNIIAQDACSTTVGQPLKLVDSLDTKT